MSFFTDPIALLSVVHGRHLLSTLSYISLLTGRLTFQTFYLHYGQINVGV
jgi:hypothetical protein